jgi:ABC-2 type transport system ATP-binding protein
MILDLIRPTSGQIFSKGVDVSQDDHWKTYTGSYLDEGFLIDYLTPEEYFEFIGGLNELTRQEVYLRLQPFIEMFNGEVLNKRKYIRDLSKGNKNKVGIAAAMMIRPQILVLDEPFANLDPTTQIRLKKILRESKAKDVTMLISSHDLNHITEVCDRIILLEKGVVIKDFTKNEDSLKELETYFST